MISKDDVILLLTEMGDSNKEDIMRVLKSPSIPLDILKKINDSRQLDLLRFYEKLRKSYNARRRISPSDFTTPPRCSTSR